MTEYVVPTPAAAAAAARWRQDLLLAFAPNFLSGGAWTNAISYGYTSAGASAAAYDFRYYASVTPGTWAIDLLVYKSNNSGIATFEYSKDGGTTWTTLSANVDLYAAATVGLVIATANIAITEAGRIDIRMRSTGTKNAASAGYYILATQASVRRTA